jgi:hypothetical protein
MIRTIAVTAGGASFSLRVRHSVAREFGWGVKMAENLGMLCHARRREKPTAVLFYRSALSRTPGWMLSSLSNLPCQVFVPSRAMNSPMHQTGRDYGGAGAFHSLWLPWKEGEERQSFGFVAQAENRESKAPRRLTITPPIIAPAGRSRGGPVLAARGQVWPLLS